MTTSSIQRPPEQVEQRPQPDVNKQAEPVAPPKRRMMVVASAVILIVAGDINFGVVFLTPKRPCIHLSVSEPNLGDHSADWVAITRPIFSLPPRAGCGCYTRETNV